MLGNILEHHVHLARLVSAGVATVQGCCGENEVEEQRATRLGV